MPCRDAKQQQRSPATRSGSRSDTGGTHARAQRGDGNTLRSTAVRCGVNADLPDGAPTDGPIAEVLAQNQEFYDAHEARDLERMAAVWEVSDRVVCIHPGWPIMRTYAHVVESWRRILSGPGRLQFILSNTAVSIDGDIAWVTVEENLLGGPTPVVVAATNMFARIDGTWRLVVHHGSPVGH